MLDLLKTLLLGIIEGITEWLPISSTGHLILLEDLLKLGVSDAFWEMFQFVIQLGAILAVVVLYFHRLNPFAPSKTVEEKRSCWGLWFRIAVAVLPSAVVGLLLDDWFDAHFYNAPSVAVMLIAYGIVYVVLELFWTRRRKTPETSSADAAPAVACEALTYREAICIGLFQTLSIMPGTSRSGSTILGGMVVGTSRVTAAEFSFFLAIPTMLGASLLKVVGFVADGHTVAAHEWGILLVGCVSAFLVSLAVVKALVGFVRRHSFLPFGVYRIALGALVLAVYFLR